MPKEHPIRLNMVNLDVREDEVRPIPNGDFEVVQLDDNPIKTVKIGSKLHSEVK